MPHPSRRLVRDFAARVAPHRAMLAAYARRLLHDPQDAADVLHEALARALERHERYDPATSFRAWVLAFVTHAAWNHNRRRRPRELAHEPWTDAAGELEAELVYAEVLRDPDAVLGRLEAPLAAGLRALPDAERAAFLLRVLGELSCGEIARVLDAPRGTVLSWLFRARARLRAELAGYARERRWRPAPSTRGKGA